MQATKLDFLSALKQSVIFSPDNTDKCKQLQTFRVIEGVGGHKLSAANFGATICDKEKPYFWSRVWHDRGYPTKIAFDFPVLAVTELNFSVDRPLRLNGQERCHEFNIVVLDKYTANCESGTQNGCMGCAGRTINEIYDDTEKMLFNSLGFLETMIFATLSPSGATGLFKRELLDAWKSGHVITDYEVNKDWGRNISSQQSNSQAYQANIPSLGLYGTGINITMCFNCPEQTEYDFSNYSKLGVTPTSAQGCSNCG